MGPSESGLAPDSASNIPEPGYALYASSQIFDHTDFEHPSPQSAEAAAQYDALAYAQQPTPQVRPAGVRYDEPTPRQYDNFGADDS